MNHRLLTLIALAGITAATLAGDVDAQSAGQIANARQRQIIEADEAHFGQAITTTTVNAGGDSTTPPTTGWAESPFDDTYVQTIRVVNTSTANYLCAIVKQRTDVTQKCTTLCTGLAAGAITCSSSGAADGALIMPGAVYSPPIGGKQCLCLEASAASTNTNATRELRAPNL